MEICITLFAMFLLFAILGVPVCFAIALSSIVILLSGGETSPVIIIQRLYMGCNNYSMQAIPFFMLAGIIMEKSGITERLVDFADAVLGWLTGGLCYATVGADMLMGGVSGSAVADTAALSSVLVPSMKQKGYPTGFAAAMLAGSGAIGIIIPPSIPMVVLGSAVGISVGKMFMGGVIPGICIGLAMMVAARIVCARKHFGAADKRKFSLSYLWISFKRAILALIAPIIIVGGILSGFFSPTESGVVVVVYSLCIGLFVYKSLNLKTIFSHCTESMKSTANVMMVVACSNIFSWILTSHNFNTLLGDALLGISDDRVFIFLFINLVFFIGGMFLDGVPLIIMLCPVFLPIATAVGIDPIVFGVSVIINVAIGTVTPPVGSTLFVASSSAGIGIDETAKFVLPIIIAMLCILLLVCFVPSLVTFIPSLMS